MRFEHPHLLWLLFLTVPGMLVFLVWAWRRKQWLISQFVQSRLLAQLTVGVSTRRQKIRMSLLVLSVALLVVVLSRPQWGFDWEEARQRGLDIVIGIDTSRSMLATDVQPNRLERAKLAALDLLALARSDRLGLVAFAGGAFLQCPLTIDDSAFRQSLQGLDTSIIPQGGTALAEAIRAAQGAFDKHDDNYKVLVLFTDGEDHDGHALEVARQAATESLRIFTVGVGTPGGELISLATKDGGADYLKDDKGQVVKSRLDESLLRQIAEAASGFYLPLSGAKTMEMLYERGLAPLPKAEFSARQIKRYHERFQWFLGLALVLLCVEMFLPEQKRVAKPEALAPSPASASLRQAVSLILLVALAGPLELCAASSGALKSYQRGNFEAARIQYEQLLEKKPDDPRLHFNAGAAAFQSHAYEDAARHFQSSLVTQDLSLQQQAYYNLGNARFRQGEETSEPEDRQAAWEQAITHYESALKLKTDDQDAQFNLELVKKKLEELKQQNKDQQQQQGQNKDGKNQDQKDQQSKQDQSKQDQQDGKNNQEQQKQEQQKQEQKQSGKDEGKQDESKDAKSQESQQAKKDEDKKAQPKPQPQQGKEGEQGDQGEQGQPAQPQAMIQMTPEQARRLLDSVKGEERALIFLPPTFTNRTARGVKNW